MSDAHHLEGVVGATCPRLLLSACRFHTQMLFGVHMSMPRIRGHPCHADKSMPMCQFTGFSAARHTLPLPSRGFGEKNLDPLMAVAEEDIGKLNRQKICRQPLVLVFKGTWPSQGRIDTFIVYWRRKSGLPAHLRVRSKPDFVLSFRFHALDRWTF